MLKIVKTENGQIKGLTGNNSRIIAFKGIPFAAPPVGDLRWKAPMPAENWEGIKEAYSFAPISIQDTPGLGTDVYCKEWHVDPTIEMNEDCLYLNVWTPAKTADEKLPVLVWFFGGAFQWGYTAEMEFNGENIAKRGVIVVSINYRLGAFGFMAHKELSKESPEAPSNFGALDQLAGLKWVKRNIEAFGGDKDNITIAGQSAGGASVLSHYTSPKSMGLFNKAIILSGIIRNPYAKDKLITPGPIEEFENLGSEFLDFLGVDNIEEARKLDAIFIRDKYAIFAENHPRFVPCIDGKFITEDPFKLMLKNKHANLPLIAGNTTNEFMIPLTDADNRQKGTGSMIEIATKAALIFNSSDAYYYSFEPYIPGDDNPGCFHSVDLWFFFETLAGSFRPFIGKHYDLARQMCNYVTNFIKTGCPNGKDSDGSEMPIWKPYLKDEKNVMHFTTDGPVTDIFDDELKDSLIESLITQNM